MIQHSGCTQESTQSMQIDSLEEDSMRSVTESKVKSHDKVLDSGDEKQSFVPLSQDSDFLSAEEDGEMVDVDCVKNAGEFFEDASLGHCGCTPNCFCFSVLMRNSKL